MINWPNSCSDDELPKWGHASGFCTEREDIWSKLTCTWVSTYWFKLISLSSSSQTIWINLLPPLCYACVNALFIDCVWPAWPLATADCAQLYIRESHFSCKYWIDDMIFALKRQANKTTRSVYCTLKVPAFRKTAGSAAVSHTAPMKYNSTVLGTRLTKTMLFHDEEYVYSDGVTVNV